MTTKRQPSIKGVVREPSHTALLPEIKEELNRIAAMYRVTPSWVRATILADSLGIKKQPKYYTLKLQKKRKRKVA